MYLLNPSLFENQYHHERLGQTLFKYLLGETKEYSICHVLEEISDEICHILSKFVIFRGKS